MKYRVYGYAEVEVTIDVEADNEDEALEVAKFMFDTGDGNWENYSFSSLEREDKDNTYKKVVNLMTKVAR